MGPFATMNEWGFAAEVKSWWDAEFKANPDWGLSRCEVERQERGGLKRSDLVVWRETILLLCGELRLPDHPVSDPWHPDNLIDAIEKATRHGSPWAFTSNGTTLLLLEVGRTGRPQERIVHKLEIAPFSERSELDSPKTLERIQAAWSASIRDIAPILVGQATPGGMSVDEVFINSLRALLAAPIAAIAAELQRRRREDREFEARLVTWMVEEQSWIHVPSEWDGEILRTARLSAYVFATRLMFYEALRRALPSMAKLDLPEVPSTIADTMLRAYFDDGRTRSGDYETLFNWDTANSFSLCSDDAIPAWRRVLDHLSVFDLSTLGYDIVGRIFERLIEPHERYRWGQHYTSPDVVDIMVSFAIPDGAGRVLDPAAGGGTFLVRAYERKRVLYREQTHQERLTELFGIDISAFATTLAAVNLATRELNFAENYPRVATKSFFSVSPSSSLLTLPPPRSDPLGGGVRDVVIKQVKAVICNPPYVRRKEIGEDRPRKEASTVLGRSVGLIPTPSRIHRLSNYHVYFWYHASGFLEPNGRLVFIAAGEWLDSDYGVALQLWLLANFRIECVMESLAEPWFSEARVGTVVLVARHCASAEARGQQLVPFVTLRKTLREFYGQPATGEEHFERVDALRDRILALSEGDGESDELDWSIVRQCNLKDLGTEEGEYVGRAWRSRLLRAPKYALELARREDFVALGELASVELGLKTGADQFFFVRAREPEPESDGWLGRRRGRVIPVRGLGGWEGELATADLVPAALNPHRLFRSGERRFSIPGDTGVFYLYPRKGRPRADLGNYVSAGERAGIHRRNLVRSNQSEQWYRQSRGVVRPPWALPYNSAYDYGAWENPKGAMINGRFLGLGPRSDVDSEILGAGDEHDVRNPHATPRRRGYRSRRRV